MAERIESLLSSQQRLLADISHELRSPLTRQQLAVSLAERELQSDKCDDKKTLHINLERIGEESARLESLIAQLLTLTRMESGQSSLRDECIDLRELLHEVVRDAIFEAGAAGKKVLLDCDEQSTFLMQGDGGLVRSSFENVVRNAVRHTSADTAVQIELREDSHVALIRVCDCGEGVDEDKLPRLFEPFFRADEARSMDGGVGLGLAITKRAVQLHSGEVSAHNLSSGGLCVKIRLPLTDAGESTLTSSSNSKS
jgi:signal transduction histidine kinase